MREVLASLAPPRLRLAEAAGARALRGDVPVPLGPLRRRAGQPRFARLRQIGSAHVTHVVLVAAFLVATGLYGALRGGQYDDFVAAYGGPGDIVARTFGLGVAAITIAGERELGEREILAAADISPRSSLLFLDVAAVRDRLQRLRLVKDVSVRKLYPNRLLIQITERRPFALWQKDGNVNLIAGDGTVLDAMHDVQDAGLPFVVGDGANKRVGEFIDLVKAAGDLGRRIRAGILLSGRRWDLKMDSGLEVKLPETDPAAAVADFVRLVRDDGLLDKDLISVDLRIPGRLVARVSAEAAVARTKALAKKQRKGPFT